MTDIVPLRQQAQVTLSGAGAGTIKLGPLSHRETWQKLQVSVRTTTAVTVGTCEARMFVGTDTSDTNYRDGTFSGDTGDTSDAISDQIRLPNSLIVTWAGGVAGDTATVVVTGEKVLT
jgi:hypothetical protein